MKSYDNNSIINSCTSDNGTSVADTCTSERQHLTECPQNDACGKIHTANLWGISALNACQTDLRGMLVVKIIPGGGA